MKYSQSTSGKPTTQLSGQTECSVSFIAGLKESFIPWQPSTWPDFDTFNSSFLSKFKRIINETMIDEVKNIFDDIKKSNGSNEHRGHALALVMLCMVDSIASYAYFNLECETCGRKDGISSGYKKFIENFFPDDYKKYAQKIYKNYRCEMVHSWNIFSMAIEPGNEAIRESKGVVSFGLENFFSALKYSINSFLSYLEKGGDEEMQKRVLDRYKDLKT